MAQVSGIRFQSVSQALAEPGQLTEIRVDGPGTRPAGIARPDKAQPARPAEAEQS